MVAFAREYPSLLQEDMPHGNPAGLLGATPDRRTTVTVKNRAGDFFWRGSDGAGLDCPETGTVAGENSRFGYDACRGVSLAQERQNSLVAEDSKTFRVPWLNSDGNNSWYTSGDIIVDYNVVEREGAWYVEPTDIRLGEGWIGGHFLDSVTVPRTFVMKFGERHALQQTNFDLFTTDQMHPNVWGAVIDYQVDKMAGFFVKVPFIYESTKRVEWSVGTVSEGTLVVYPFE